MSAERDSRVLVVDASVAVKWYLAEEESTEAGKLLDPVLDLHVPSLLYAEIGQVLWKRVHQRHELAAESGQQILDELLRVPLTVHPLTVLVGEAYRLALETGRTVYGSVYLALAIRVGGRLVTADRRLVNALRDGPYGGLVLGVSDSLR